MNKPPMLVSTDWLENNLYSTINQVNKKFANS